MAIIKCTICGDKYEQYTIHKHNPCGKPINQIEELEKIFEE
jgi:hypothetical protein